MRIMDFIKDNKLFVFAIVLSSFLLLSFSWVTIASNVTNRDKLIELERSRSINQYSQTFYNIFSKVEIIETYIEVVGEENLTQELFEKIEISNNHEDIGIVSFSYAPNGIIEYYSSDNYDLSLVGYDLVNDDREIVRDAVEYAIENQVIVVNGPFELIQGDGEGIVFRKPIFDDGDFKGLINVVLDLDVINEHLQKYDDVTINTAIYDNEDNVIFGSEEGNKELIEKSKMNLEYVDWHIGVSIAKQYNRTSTITNSLIVLGFIGILLIVDYLWIYYYRKNKTLLMNQNQLIYYDNLTSLPNRRLFVEETTMLIKNKTPFFLGFGDLDNFKNINDVLGHTIGDKYLSFVASHLEKLESDDLKVYRWGGDEFIFIFLNSYKTELYPTLDHIFEIFKKPFEVKDTKHQISISMGMVEYPIDGSNLDELVKRADIVMYDIKSQYKNTYSFFEQKYLTDLYTQIEFQQQIEKHDVSEFQVFLQPIVDVESNNILGFEGLSRLFDENGKAYPISDIIKLFEQDGTITKLDKYVFHQICEYISIFESDYTNKYFFTFNISPLSLTSDFIDYIERIVHGFKVDPNLIVIEIIETLGFKDVKISVELLHRIKRIGFRIAMDDFGMGYSSLSYIAKLPLDMIKIDRSFIQNYETDAFNRTILQTIKDISNSLHLEILVEGIETKKQLNYVTNLGTNYYQGYLHSKPMSFKDIQKLISKK